MRRLCLRLSGTSPSTMRRARPSTIAVLPTPGSPMSTGLFFVRRDSTWMTRRISSSRPMTGSILPARRLLGEVAAVLLERLVLLLGVLRGDAMAAPHLCHRGEQGLALDPDAVGEGEEEVLGGQVLVVQVGAGGVGVVDHGLELARQAGLAAVGLGELGDGVRGRVAQLERRLAEPLEDGEDDALLLAEQGGEQVVGGDLRVALGLGRVERRG